MQERSTASTAARARSRTNGRAPLWPWGLLALVGTILAAGTLAGGADHSRGAPPGDGAALVLTTDFDDGTLQGLHREPEGALVLDDDPLPPEQRPRAYAHRAAFGVYSSPTVELAHPMGHVEATLDADLPAGAEAVLEVRGRTAAGRWTPWTEVEPSGPAVSLDAPATALAYRLVLLADSVGPDGPRLRRAAFTLHAASWRLMSADVSSANPPTMRVWATREGLVGARTANGHLIAPNDKFVALPSRRVLNALDATDYTVTIHYKGRTATAPVWDLGPWNIRDNYWDPARELFADLPRWVPQSQAAFFTNHNQGRDQYGRFITLPTALDIADGTFWDDLGMTVNDWVEVTFNWVDAPSPPWPPPVTVLPKATPTPQPKPKAASYNAPPGGANRSFLPVVLRGFEGWSSRIQVQNPNAGPVNGTIELYNRDGSLQATLPFALAPHASATYPPSAFDGLPERFAGAGIVNANAPLGVLVNQERPDMDRMTYASQGVGASTLYAPLIVKDQNNWDTILHVQNVGNAPADVQITYYSSGGVGPTWTDTATIPPYGARAFSQFQHPQLPAGFVGSAVIRSPNGGQLVAVVNEVKTEGAAVSYPALSGGAPNVFAPFVLRNYQGWSTGLQVQNLGNAPTTAIITYQRGNGPGTWTESALIPPGAAVVFYQPANPQLPNDFMGSAQIASSDAAPLAVLVNVINPQSTAAMNYVAGPPSAPVVPLPFVARNAEGWSTSVLVHNPNSVPAVASITYYDANGNPVARDEDALSPGAAKSYFQQRQTALPDGFAGSAVVQSPTGQALTAITSEVYTPPQ